MRTCSFRLQIASAAAMAVALMVCSSPHANEPTDFYQALGQAFEWTLKEPEFRAEADRLALEIDLVTGETLQAMVERMLAPRARWSRSRARRLANGEGPPCGNLFEAGAATGPPASDITALSS